MVKFPWLRENNNYLKIGSNPIELNECQEYTTN